MASNQTTSYGLNQWEATDKVERLDFNADNEKIDAGIKAAQEAADNAQTAADNLAAVAYTAENAPFVVGSYTGNGSTSQTISLGFKPKAVLVFRAALMSSQWATGAYFGMATAQVPLSSVLVLNETGFAAGYYSTSSSSYAPMLNESGSTYVYIALK